jgi:prolyl-tRNA synthetase
MLRRKAQSWHGTTWQAKRESVLSHKPTLLSQVQALLAEIQIALLEDATAFRDQHIIDVADLDTFKQVIESGNFARVWWNENSANELHIKEETSATLRCYPFEQPDGNGKDLLTGESADRVALFAKAY